MYAVLPEMFDMMDWNPDHRYKMLGNIIRANGEYLIAFDLTSTEVYQRTYDAEGAKSTASRTPVYPIGWQNQFGMTLNEHKQSMLVNIFDAMPSTQSRKIRQFGKVRQQL